MKILFSTAFLCLLSIVSAFSQQELTAEKKTEMLTLVNNLRTGGCKCGGAKKPKVVKLVWNIKLEQAALTQASDMAKMNKLTHQGSDGSEHTQRIDRTGYTARATGENVAWNYPDISSVMEGWHKSTGHCNNIMSKEFTEMGAAKVGNYWVQVFADPF